MACYECTAKTAPKSYPVCTIRNTPDRVRSSAPCAAQLPPPILLSHVSLRFQTCIRSCVRSCIRSCVRSPSTASSGPRTCSSTHSLAPRRPPTSRNRREGMSPYPRVCIRVSVCPWGICVSVPCIIALRRRARGLMRGGLCAQEAGAAGAEEEEAKETAEVRFLCSSAAACGTGHKKGSAVMLSLPHRP